MPENEEIIRNQHGDIVDTNGNAGDIEYREFPRVEIPVSESEVIQTPDGRFQFRPET